MWNGSVLVGDVGLIIMVGVIAVFFADSFGAAVAGQHRAARLDDWDAGLGSNLRQRRAVGLLNIASGGFGIPARPAPSPRRRSARADQPARGMSASGASTGPRLPNRAARPMIAVTSVRLLLHPHHRGLQGFRPRGTAAFFDAAVRR